MQMVGQSAISSVLATMVKELGCRGAYHELKLIRESIRDDGGKSFADDLTRQERDVLSDPDNDAVSVSDRRWVRRWFATLRAALPFLVNHEPRLVTADCVEFVGFAST